MTFRTTTLLACALALSALTACGAGAGSLRGEDGRLASAGAADEDRAHPGGARAHRHSARLDAALLEDGQRARVTPTTGEGLVQPRQEPTPLPIGDPWVPGR
jgi:hypothetical protein